MANYLTNDTDLESVADAIRTKGGTSAQLEFPSGFVDAIDAISGGGGDSGELIFNHVKYTWETVTAGANTITNCSQVESYLKGLSSIPSFAAGWVFSITKDVAPYYNLVGFSSNVNATSGYRYRDGTWTEIKGLSGAAPYDAKINAGTKFIICWCIISTAGF